MKRVRNRNILTVSTIVLLLFSLLFSVSCTKKVKPREKAVNEFQESILKIYDKGFTNNKKDNEIRKMSDPGKYIVAKAWADFYGNVIRKSDLKEGQIKKIAEMFSKKDTNNAIADLNFLNKSIVDALKEIQLNSVNIKSLFVSMLDELLNNNFVEKYLVKANKLLAKTTNKVSMGEAISILEELKNSLNILNKDKETIETFKREKETIGDFVETISKIADEPISNRFLSFFLESKGNIKKIESLANGILEDATADEINKYLKLVINNMIELYERVESAQGRNMTKTITQITESFNRAMIPSGIINSAVDYLDIFNYAMQYSRLIVDGMKKGKEVLDDATADLAGDIYKILQLIKNNKDHDDISTLFAIPISKFILRMHSEKDAKNKIVSRIQNDINTGDIPESYAYAAMLMNAVVYNETDNDINKILSDRIQEKLLRKAYVRMINKRSLALLYNENIKKRILKQNMYAGWKLDNIVNMYNACADINGTEHVHYERDISAERVRALTKSVREKINEKSDMYRTKTTTLSASVVEYYFDNVEKVIKTIADLKVPNEYSKVDIDKVYYELKKIKFLDLK
jgi:lipoprotein